MTEKLLLIDANALIHRAYHAYPPNLRAKDGTLTNAVFGFTTILFETLLQFKPTHVVSMHDAGKITFRNAKYAEYKAHRKPLPDDLRAQMPLVREVLTAFGIPQLVLEGFEADDLIGTIVNSPSFASIDKIVVSGDQDLLQLVSDSNRAAVYLAGSTYSTGKEYHDADVQEKYGFAPLQMIDYKGLLGDPSDNIPGVAGIGKKSAVELLQEFLTVEKIYEAIDADDERWQAAPWKKYLNKLVAGRESAFLSKDLATIHSGVEVKLDLAKATLADFDLATLQRAFEKYGFRSLQVKLPKLLAQLGIEKAEEQANFLSSVGEAAPAEIPFTPVIITSEAEAEKLCRLIAKTNTLVFDTETTSQHYLEVELVGIGLGSPDWAETYYLPAEFALSEKIKPVLQKQFSRFVLATSGSALVAHNLKYDLHSLMNCEIVSSSDILQTDARYWEDTMLAAYILQAGDLNEGKGLKELAQNRLGLEMVSLQSLWEQYGDGSKELDARKVPVAELGKYCCLDVCATLNLWKYWQKAWVGKESLLKLYRDIEVPIIAVLIVLEREGVALDEKYLADLAIEAEERLASLQESLNALAEAPMNISSPRQVGELLFGKLKLQEQLKFPISRTKSGQYSTDERTLLNFADSEPVQQILSYREMAKMLNTYIKGLPQQILASTGRVHTSYNQAVASTGRLSSTEPNLQNIPVSSDFGSRIRKAFSPGEGRVFLAFDYAQQELRVLAHFSAEEKLIQAFREGVDIHTLTASELLEVPLVEVTKEQRRIGKTVNFGIVYGISAFGLADRLKIPQAKAQEFITKFFTRYPHIKAYFDGLKEQARNQGYVETIYGRRRDAAGLHGGGAFQQRAAMERELLNFPLQGSAADIMKLAMLAVKRTLAQGEQASGKAELFGKLRLHLQVHDELILSAPVGLSQAELQAISTEICQQMGDVLPLSVPLVVDTEIGPNWYELQPLG